MSEYEEIERLRELLASFGRTATMLINRCIDAQNELQGIERGGPATRSLCNIERTLETMAQEAADAAGGE
jgi:hypothetical protein